MKAGDLVKYKNEVGIVLGACTKRWAEFGDIWVLWHHSHRPKIESPRFLELVSESR